MPIYLFFSLLFMTISFAGKGMVFQQSVDKLKHLSTEEFLKKFPYQAILASDVFQLDDINQFEFQRHYLDSLNLDGDAYLEHLIEAYLQLNNIDFEHLELLTKEIQMGEFMAHIAETLPGRTFVYQVLSNMILDNIAKQLQQGILDKQLKIQDFNIQYTIQRLRENHFHIDLPTSNLVKARTHLANGNFSYLWLKATTTYIQEFILLCIITLILFSALFVFVRQMIRNRKRKKGTTTISPIIMILLWGSLITSQISDYQTSLPNNDLVVSFVHYPVNTEVSVSLLMQIKSFI